jgi:hypothetical protein
VSFISLEQTSSLKVPKVLSLNLDSVIYLPFQLNIPHVEPHLLKGSLSSHVRESVKVLIKCFISLEQTSSLKVHFVKE